jgi:hypothetical protein
MQIPQRPHQLVANRQTSRILKKILLRQIPHAKSAPEGQLARVRGLQSRQNFQQGGFPRSVGTDQPCALIIRKAKRKPFEQRTGAETFGKVATTEKNGHAVLSISQNEIRWFKFGGLSF